MRLSLFLSLSLVTALSASAAAFQNGSFEASSCDPSAGGFNTPGVGNNCITGWTVTQANVDYINGYWTASDGTHSIDLNGDQFAGGIQQTFDTNAAHLYQVTFDLAGNPDGNIKTLDAIVAGVSNSFKFDTAGQNNSNMGWVTETFTFVSSVAGAETLQFLSTTTNVCCQGPAIDNVILTDLGRANAVPEPSTLLLVAPAFGALAWLRRRT